MGDQLKLKDDTLVVACGIDHGQRREAVAEEEVGHAVARRVGQDGDQVAGHDLGRGADRASVGGGLHLGGGDQAGEVLDTEVQGLAIAGKESVRST